MSSKRITLNTRNKFNKMNGRLLILKPCICCGVKWNIGNKLSFPHYL